MANEKNRKRKLTKHNKLSNNTVIENKGGSGCIKCVFGNLEDQNVGIFLVLRRKTGLNSMTLK